jgi:Cysteine-rich CPCC
VHKCPCCEFLTLSEEPPGTYEICPVCYWEDDGVQYDDPDYEGGANHTSLNQAKHNLSEFGAAESRNVKWVRKPLSEEIP